MSGLQSDTAIDFGSTAVRMLSRTSSRLVSEPAVLAVRSRGSRAGEVLAVGAEAAAMEGRESELVSLCRPVRGGVIHDLEAALELVDRVAPRHWAGRSVRRPNVLFAVPHALTPIERRVLAECAFKVGARGHALIPTVVAAAVGADLPIDHPIGTCVIDMGAEKSEAGVLAFGGVSAFTRLPFCGRAVDRAIVDYLRRKFDLVVSERAAEHVKREIGSAEPRDESDRVEIRGRHAMTGLPARGFVAPEEIREAIEPELARLGEGLRRFLSALSPELASDLCDRGIVLTGGSALLPGLAERLRSETGLVVVRDEAPQEAVVRGLHRLLLDRDVLNRLVV